MAALLYINGSPSDLECHGLEHRQEVSRLTDLFITHALHFPPLLKPHAATMTIL